MGQNFSLSQLERAYTKDPSSKEAVTRYLTGLLRAQRSDQKAAVVSAIMTLLKSFPRHQQVEWYQEVFGWTVNPNLILNEEEEASLGQIRAKERRQETEDALEAWLAGDSDPAVWDLVGELEEGEKDELRRLFSLSEHECFEQSEDRSQDSSYECCDFRLGSRIFRQVSYVEWSHEVNNHSFKDRETGKAFGGKANWQQLKSELKTNLRLHVLICFVVLLRFGSFAHEEANAYLEGYEILSFD